MANFIGALNLLPATLRDPATGAFDAPAGPVTLGRRIEGRTGEALSLAIRPEGLRLVGADEAAPGVTFAGRLVARDFLGSIIRLRAEVAGDTVLVVDCFNRDRATIPLPGQPVRLAVQPEAVVLLA